MLVFMVCLIFRPLLRSCFIVLKLIIISLNKNVLKNDPNMINSDSL